MFSFAPHYAQQKPAMIYEKITLLKAIVISDMEKREVESNPKKAPELMSSQNEKRVKQKEFIKSIPLDVLNHHVFTFFSNYDLAKTNTTSKEWSAIATQTQINKKASHVVREFIGSDSKLPFQKIRFIGDEMDSSVRFKISERMQIQIFYKEKNQDKRRLKKTTATLLNKQSYDWVGSNRFYLSDNRFDITHIDLNRIDCLVYTKPLFSPCEKRLLEALKSKNQSLALKLVEDIPYFSDLKDEKGKTLLEYASDLHYHKVAQKLRDKGILSEDEKEGPPRHYFRINDQLNISQQVEDEAPPLSHFEKRFVDALLSKNEKDALALIKYINNPNIVDEDGYPVLARAAKLGYLGIVNELVAKKADLEKRTTYQTDSSTALLKAAYEGKFDVINYLVEHGANVNAQNNLGDTILHLIHPYAYSNLLTATQFEELCSFLLKHGANPCITNLHDKRPADLHFSLMSQATMETDAEKRVESCSFNSTEGAYYIKFKDISYRDKSWACEAIYSKMKSLPVNDKLVLASSIWTQSAFPNRGRELYNVPSIPRQDYAIKSIEFNNKLNTLTIQIKPGYVNNEVCTTIAKGLTELKLLKPEENMVVKPEPKQDDKRNMIMALKDQKSPVFFKPAEKDIAWSKLDAAWEKLNAYFKDKNFASFKTLENLRSNICREKKMEDHELIEHMQKLQSAIKETSSAPGFTSIIKTSTHPTDEEILKNKVEKDQIVGYVLDVVASLISLRDYLEKNSAKEQVEKRVTVHSL